jgi:hypothetical protein
VWEGGGHTSFLVLFIRIAVILYIEREGTLYNFSPFRERYGTLLMMGFTNENEHISKEL